MGTKLNPSEFDCYDRALPDEPMFTLLAHDPDAAEVVRYWIKLRADRVTHSNTITGEALAREIRKIGEATACADAMDMWREAHKDHVPSMLKYMSQMPPVQTFAETLLSIPSGDFGRDNEQLLGNITDKPGE